MELEIILTACAIGGVFKNLLLTIVVFYIKGLVGYALFNAG